MAVSILLLLAGVVVLSAATRKPCLRVSTAPWHLCKSGRMTKPGGQEACKLRVAAEAHVLQAGPQESLVSLPRVDLPHEETLSPLNSILTRIRHFRSPPALG
jgi:hypothetical protein